MYNDTCITCCTTQFSLYDLRGLRQRCRLSKIRPVASKFEQKKCRAAFDQHNDMESIGNGGGEKILKITSRDRQVSSQKMESYPNTLC